MQTHIILSRLLRCCQPFMHAARWQALHDVALAAVCGKALTLTALALGIARHSSLRHRIKCVDRLLGNPHLRKLGSGLASCLVRITTCFSYLDVIITH